MRGVSPASRVGAEREGCRPVAISVRWCLNRHDEAPFLSRTHLRALNKRYGVNYTVLQMGEHQLLAQPAPAVYEIQQRICEEVTRT